MSAIIPNITSYPTPNPNPHSDASQYPFSHPIDAFQDPSAFHLLGAPVDATPFEHVGVTMNEPTNTVFVTTNQPEIILPFHCEVCNISCNTKDVLELHKKGKKHLKNEKKLANLSANAPTMVPPPVASETVAEALDNKMHRLLQNGATAETLLYCDVCNVICNNQEGFQKHVASKKHSAKSIIQLAGTNAVFDATSDSSGGIQKKPAGFPCEICKIVCTSDELLKMHIAGKKHLKKVKDSGQMPNPSLLVTPIASEDTPPTNPVVNPESNEDKTFSLHGAIQSTDPESNEDKTVDLHGAMQSTDPESGEDKTVNLHGAIQSTDPESSEDKTVNLHGAIQSTDPESGEGKVVILHGAKRNCELCGISCDTDEVLNSHLSGKKHRKNLEKSEKLIGPNPAEIPKVIGPFQEQGESVGSKRKGKKGGGDDDVETKKQRILESGTALDAVQICNLCNVVCNSQKVFIAHLAGQKHVAMAVKQAETQASQAIETGQES